MIIGKLACKLFKNLKREAAAVKIQKHARRFEARTAYKRLQSSVLVVQTGLRAMAARNEFRFRKQTKAAIIIQVPYLYFHRSKRYLIVHIRLNIFVLICKITGSMALP